MENNSQGDILGNKDAPFINSLAAQNAVAAGYRDNLVHPSEPNYIWMVAGENFGVLDDNDPIVAPPRLDLAHRRSARGRRAVLEGATWSRWASRAGSPHGIRTQPKHDPFVYFNDINGWDGTAFQPSARCNSHVVDYSQFDADLAAASCRSTCSSRRT